MTTGLAKLEAGDKPIRDIFGGKYAFSIPPYQRAYAWEVSHVTTLLDDLLFAMDNADASDGSDLYFLGSIVLVKLPKSIEARVVDGQQRLTTLTILFSVLRDLTTDEVAKHKRDRHVKQQADPDTGAIERLRFQMREKDQKFFAKTIQAINSTSNLPDATLLESSERRVVENAEAIKKVLSELKEERRDDLIRYMLTNCFLVVVEVPTDKVARRIFTVLNARGLDLSAQDILKAELLENAGSDVEQELSNQWQELETMLEPKLFSDLFTHIRMIYQREKPRNSLEEGFPQFVTPFRSSPKTFIPDVLEPYSEALDKTERSQHWIAEKFGYPSLTLLKSLNRLDNKDWVAPFIYALKLAREDALFNFSEFVERLERLAYFHFATRADVNVRIRRYADVLNELDPEYTSELRLSGLTLSLEESFAFFEHLDKPIYLNRRLPKPLLLRLDQAMSDATATYNHSIVSVEHVLPQNPKSDSVWRKNFTEEESSDWLHKVGNLVLLDQRKNSSASNWDFERKKNTYFRTGDSSPFELTRQVLNETDWTPAIISQRQAASLKAYANTWNLNDEYRKWCEIEELI